MDAAEADVLIVGAGPAGLAAATELRRMGAGHVMVAERERVAGGVPRHTGHLGFGMRDLHRVLSGPAYARRYVEKADGAGVDLRCETSVTHWVGDRSVSMTSPAGIREVTARAVVLATGCRERPRSARLVPGDRPLGVFTTGSVQQMVHMQGMRVGRRAVVVGAEHVSFSAVWTLVRSGTEVVALVTEQPHHESYAALALATTGIRRIPVLRQRRVTRIVGRPRVEAVEVADMVSGAVSRIDCDTVVFTGDWVPERELAAAAGLAMNAGTNGPSVDGDLRTSTPGVFAAGNLLRGAETSDVAAAEGQRVAVAVTAWLEVGGWIDERALPLTVVEPLCWVVPDRVTRLRSASGTRTQPTTLRVGRFVDGARLTAEQATETVWTGRRSRHLVPGRLVHLPDEWLSRVQPEAGPITIRLGSG